ncbi:hypothetical protein, partial [Paenibacillus cisolokensis]|uniref:hypothetical protein n=1 Tax=Paenibacillus cisolokensis TaxID=1658519 RepID=UPI001BCD743E
KVFRKNILARCPKIAKACALYITEAQKPKGRDGHKRNYHEGKRRMRGEHVGDKSPVPGADLQAVGSELVPYQRGIVRR